MKWHENKLHIKINVNFYLQNILRHSGEHDLIWVNGVISHIYPITDFIETCYKNLKIDGNLIIADGNKLNPHTNLFLEKE